METSMAAKSIPLSKISKENRRRMGLSLSIIVCLLAVLLINVRGSAQEQIQPRELIARLELSNSADYARKDAAVYLDLESLGLAADDSRGQSLVVEEKGVQTQSQVIDMDGDGVADTLLVLSDYEPAEVKHFKVYSDAVAARARAMPQRVYTEVSQKVGGHWKEGKSVGDLTRGSHEYMEGHFVNVQHLDVPSEHSDHSWYIRYEGPGIESEEVGYRQYLDWRNGMDIFGKKTTSMVLSGVGQDGFDSYHEPSPWGQDILKVGDALGLGSYGYFDGKTTHRVSDFSASFCRILNNGPVYASYEIGYLGWHVAGYDTDITARISMQAGSRLAHVELKLSKRLPVLCTGIVKEKGVNYYQGDLESITGEAYSYIATWGKQSLAGDNLGMAVIFKHKDVRELTADDLNYLVTLRTDGLNMVDYYFLAAWEGEEPGGIKTEAEFLDYVKQQCRDLTVPLRMRKWTEVGTMAKQYPITGEMALTWSKRMADSQIAERGEHLALHGMDNDQGIVSRWGYTTGLINQAYDDLAKATGNMFYRDFAERVIASFINEDGTIETYDLKSYNIDNINSGKMVLRLWQYTGKEKYKKAADLLRSQLKDHPRTSEGGFWHKQRYPYQLWLDGVYMGMPFLAEYEVLFDNNQHLDEAVNEFVIVSKHCRDPKTGLFYHAWDEKKAQGWANPETGLSQNFWGRGFGWYCMALVDTLEIIPEDPQDLRRPLIDILKDASATLVKYQDPETGLWWQILDKAGAPGNYRESSASAMFTYALCKGINEGYLPKDKYGPAVSKAYEGIVRDFVEVHADGSIDLTGCVIVGGLGYGRDGSYEYYMSEPIRDNDPKAIGPFIMAGIQIEKLLKK